MKLATDIFAVVIALAGFAVSYTTQALLASQHGFLTWEAWLGRASQTRRHWP